MTVLTGGCLVDTLPAVVCIDGRWSHPGPTVASNDRLDDRLIRHQTSNSNHCAVVPAVRFCSPLFPGWLFLNLSHVLHCCLLSETTPGRLQSNTPPSVRRLLLIRHSSVSSGNLFHNVVWHLEWQSEPAANHHVLLGHRPVTPTAWSNVLTQYWTHSNSFCPFSSFRHKNVGKMGLKF